MKKIRHYAEKIKRLLFSTPFGASLAAFLCAVLLGSAVFKTQTGKIAFLGTAFFTACWCENVKILPVCAGTVIGSLIAGNFMQAAVPAALGAVYVFTRRKHKISKTSKRLISAAVQMVSFAFAPDMNFLNAGIYTGGVCVAVLIAFFAGEALKGLRTLKNAEPISDARLICVSLMAGLITFSFGSFSFLNISPGIIFAAVYCMCISYIKGAAAVACAAVVSAGRILACGGDMVFTAVLCSCTLAGCLAGKLSFWGTAGAFSLAAAVFAIALNGAGALSFAEILLSAAIFVFLPQNIKALLNENSSVKKTERLNERMEHITKRLTYLSDVLKELSRLFESGTGKADGFIHRQLSGVSTSLKRLINENGTVPEKQFSVNFGCAARPKRGNDEIGDSCCVYEADGKLIAAISDGMGSGNAARRESMQAVALISDLMAVGFKPNEAAECVNRLLMLKEEGEMYATLDAAQFDLATGHLSLVKHGAPPSFVLRNGKLCTLYAEALPVGIIEDARPACCTVDMRRGDAFVMMSDGVSDALGNELIASVTEKLETAADSQTAAKLLLSLAEEKGRGNDDMTVVVAKIA